MAIVTQTNAKRLAQTSKMYDHAVVYTTFRCTMRCPLCICKGSPYQPDMTQEQYARILSSLKDQHGQIDMLTFSGGEPTLCGWLPEAITMARQAGTAKRIRVISNGIFCRAQHYGDADIVYLTHYGACNRVDLLRLKKELGKRCVIRWAAHYQHTLEYRPDVVPASCACVHFGFVGDRVYTCGYTAARGTGAYYDLWSDRYYLDILNRDPQMQPECHVCQWNEWNHFQKSPRIVAEVGLWDSRHNVMIELPGADKAVRRVMRRFGLLNR